jgi:hypothetical protein
LAEKEACRLLAGNRIPPETYRLRRILAYSGHRDHSKRAIVIAQFGAS